MSILDFAFGCIKSLVKTEIRNKVNDARKWECQLCQDIKTHRAQQYVIDGKTVCQRCKRKLKG